MKGLELAERSYLEWGRGLIAQRFPDYEDRVAVGLVGEGSECLGFDDELSQDHDWGGGFCIWLNESDFIQIGEDLERRYGEACNEHGAEAAVRDSNSGKRRGVFEIRLFYSRFIYYDHVPNTLAEWRSVPEAYLATATNGRVFADPLGEFSAFREGLLAFYPEDVRLKKLAARCAEAAQSGQYNYSRCVARSEYVAAHSALTAFSESAMSIIYLLNRRYRPFYKWMHRGLKELPVLGGACYDLLARLFAEAGEAAPPDTQEKDAIIEKISELIVRELLSQGLSDSDGGFLLDHAYSVQSRIADEGLRLLHVMMG